ncbi:hypothetical protein Gotri_027542, partial [Gossypium trilobum]|nr:hypothetical protein [Gossypium trilobum]
NPKRKNEFHGSDVAFLSRLRKLNLRDSNLREGDIPSDISCLSSLNKFDLSDIPSDVSSLSSLILLDLSGKNFNGVPSTLTRLSKLQTLRLSNCKELKSVPELLTSIEDVRLDGCASLEVDELASPLEVPNLALSTFTKVVFIFVNDDASRDEAVITCRAVIHCRIPDKFMRVTA